MSISLQVTLSTVIHRNKIPAAIEILMRKTLSPIPLALILATLLFGYSPVASAQTIEPISGINELEIPTDPMDSPHPIPWQWIMTTYEEVQEGTAYYRTPSLVSPNGKYAAYSRIEMKVQGQFFQSIINSTMFVENLETGELQKVMGTTPLGVHLAVTEGEDHIPGVMMVLIPVSWSANGDRLLARQFEGFLSTSDASDYALIWDTQTRTTTTLSPNGVEYTNAVLLGWDSTADQQVVFRAGILGEERWNLWAVGSDGQTQQTTTASPLLYGQTFNYPWTGGQILLSSAHTL